jgi:hypothetical protein
VPPSVNTSHVARQKASPAGTGVACRRPVMHRSVKAGHPTVSVSAPDWEELSDMLFPVSTSSAGRSLCSSST